MEFKIEKAEGKDFEEIYGYFEDLSEELKEDYTTSLQNLKDNLKNINCFICKNDKWKIVWFITFCEVFYTFYWKSLYLDIIYVEKNSRKKWIWKKLIEKVVDFWKKEKCEIVDLLVLKWNTKLVEFYKKLWAEESDIFLNLTFPLWNN